MKKILLILAVFLITASQSLAVSRDECMDSWSVKFDEIDENLMQNLEAMMKQSGQNTSTLTMTIPQIMRTYRCELYATCLLVNSPTKTKIKIIACQDYDVDDFGDISQQCLLQGDLQELEFIKKTCYVHADFKIEQLKAILPFLIEKDANRKKMSYLAYRITTLTEKIAKFSDKAKDFNIRFTKVMDQITCIVKKCD
ncbi:MAG: hypothetical protein N4A36_00505 [Candidatus Gracilibacteria bacterium]|jgi:hypothetical protein|nr:hypothetical protein [Candidatus Gracilibacteria bacterium]